MRFGTCSGVRWKLGPEACRTCRIRIGLGACTACIIRAFREGGAAAITEWGSRLQAYLNDDELGRQLREFERQNLRDWLNGWAIQVPPKPHRPDNSNATQSTIKQDPEQPHHTPAANRELEQALLLLSGLYRAYVNTEPAGDQFLQIITDLLARHEARIR